MDFLRGNSYNKNLNHKHIHVSYNPAGKFRVLTTSANQYLPNTCYVKKFFLPFVFIALCLQASGQWSSVYPPGGALHRYLYKAIILPGSSSYLAAGNNFAVSADNGSSWSVTQTNSLPYQLTAGMHFTDLVFTTSTTGYLVVRNEIFKTQDSGATWNNLLTIDRSHPKYSASANFNAMSFPDPLTGYAVGDFDKIFKTTDGGISWDTLRWSSSTSPHRSYSDVVFINADTGYVSGYEVPDILMNFGFDEFVMITRDGGKTWDTHPVNTPNDFKGLDIQFVNPQTGFLHTHRTQLSDKIWVSNNSARTWTEITPPHLRKGTCMYWITADTGLVFGENINRTPALFRTTDRGQTWNEVTLPATGVLTRNSIQDINFIDPVIGFTVGDGGAIFTTRDAGATWTQANPGYAQYYLLDFASDNTGYASTGYGFYSTQDGGNFWEFAPKSDSLMLVSLDATQNNSYALGVLNRFYKINSSSHLEHQTLPVSFLYTAKISIMQNQDSIYLAGYSVKPGSSPPFTNAFIRSYNGGLTWETFEIIDGSSRIVNVQRMSDLFFAATTKAIFISRNRGELWENVATFQTDILKDVAFLDRQQGVALFVSNHLMRTNDQGKTWTAIPPLSQSDHDIYGLMPVNGSLVFAYGTNITSKGSYGAIWKSADGGQTWSEEVLPVTVDYRITKMCVGENFVYATGGNGQILRMRIPVNVTSVDHVVTDTEINVHPVPAYDQINISVNTRDLHVTQVDICAMDGRRVQSFPVTTTDNEFTINISHFPPGLYLLRFYHYKGVSTVRFSKRCQ